MIVRKIKLMNFRNHENFLLECKKNTSLITGENGSGKTSVLEAIYETLRGKSFRASDKEILRRGTDFYRVELDYVNGEKMIVTFDGQKKYFFAGDKKTARLPRKYRYPVVLFLPDDLHLVATSPIKRRIYFDRIIAEFDEVYGNTLLRYEKILKQRNELLKNIQKIDEKNKCERKKSIQNYRNNSEEMFSWNILLAKYGCIIKRKRKEYVELLNKYFNKVYHSIIENNDVVLMEYIEYGENMSEEEYFKQLENDFQKDVIIGHTSFGVHRDDFLFVFNNEKADGTASRGEIRSMVLAMKFIEAELIFQKTKKKPVVLLDDVFSELDSVRQKSLVKNFKDNQVILTSVNEI